MSATKKRFHITLLLLSGPFRPAAIHYRFGSAGRPGELGGVAGGAVPPGGTPALASGTGEVAGAASAGEPAGDETGEG
jgi:hypothetical protein